MKTYTIIEHDVPNDTEYVRFLHSLGLSFHYPDDLFPYVAHRYAQYLAPSRGSTVGDDK